MSAYVRYLLTSAGVQATEEQMKAIDDSGYPYELSDLIAQCKGVMSAEQGMHAMLALIKSGILLPRRG